MYIQQWLIIKFGRMQAAVKTGEMGHPDELKSLVSNSCQVANPFTLMIGYQFQLLITETEFSPQTGYFLMKVS